MANLHFDLILGLKLNVFIPSCVDAVFWFHADAGKAAQFLQSLALLGTQCLNSPCCSWREVCLQEKEFSKLHLAGTDSAANCYTLDIVIVCTLLLLALALGQARARPRPQPILSMPS